MKVTQNISRLKYLLELYRLSIDDLLKIISKGLKSPIQKTDILTDEIKISHLKRIDAVFEKGLHYYLDPKSPEVSKDASIFFRKEKFDTDLNLGAKKIVNHFEEFKLSLSAIAKLSDINFKRQFNVSSLEDSPKKVAQTIRKHLYPDYMPEQRDFLKAFIGKLAVANILVFEFVETWNKKEKANIDGFFLNPNVIVIKRNQVAMRREIFTLAHELGHYLLKAEEVEEFDYNKIIDNKISAVERWCNDFAFHFLAGSYADVIENLSTASTLNDYHDSKLADVVQHTHLSKTALYTRLLYLRKISSSNYSKIKEDIEKSIRARIEKERKARELEAKAGAKQQGSVPKPINSPLLISTIQTAFHEGVIDEYEVCRTLNIKPENLDDYIQ